jgi:hypothetical protein
MPAESVPEPGILLAEIERLAGRVAEDQAKGLLIESIEALDQAGGIDVAPHAIEGAQETAASVQPGGIDTPG